MQEIQIDKIIRSSRKSFSIEINKDGKIILRVPNNASRRKIKDLIKNKSQWILKKQIDIENKKKNIKLREFKSGEIFKCLDKDYELILVDNFKYAFRNSDNKLYLNSEYEDHAKQFLIKWYKSKAYTYISSKTEEYAKKLNQDFNHVKISNAKTRWGSCSSNRNLNFSWRLIIAPSLVVDYVIVHELAHLIEMNHSKRFWKIVGSITPNYKIYETWLKDNGYLLDI